MPLANYPGDALPLRKTVPLDNIDTSEDETAWLKLHPTEVLSPPPTGPNFSSSTSSPERARQAEAGSGGNQPFVVIPLPSQNTPQWQAEPSQQEPGHAKADKGPPPERADRVDEEFHAYRSPPASTDLPPEILAIPVEEAFPSTYTYDFKTEDGAIPGMKPAPAIPAQAEKSIPMSSVW